MKKISTLILSLTIILLVGCNGNTTENEYDDGADVEEVNEVLIDDDIAEITLIDIVRESEKDVDLYFEIKNKSDKNIFYESHVTFVDNYNSTDLAVFDLIGDVSKGETEKTSLSLGEVSGELVGDLPDFEENVELILTFYNLESENILIEYPLEIEL